MDDWSGPGRAGTPGARSTPTSDAESFRWLVDGHPDAKELVADVIDAVRVLRAADALRQRGTTLRTSAGYEVCVDRRTGRAVMAVRSSDERFGAWMWLDSRHSVAEGNLRVVDLTPDGSLRFAFHRGTFSEDGATDRVVRATTETIVDVEADALGSFPRRDGARRSDRLVQIVPPPDDAGFAALVIEALQREHPHLAGRVVSVSEPLPVAAVEVADWQRRASRVAADDPEVGGWFERFSRHGLNVDAVDRRAAMEDVLRVRLRPGERVLTPGTAASVVVIPLGPGIRVEPIGGYRPQDAHPWLPIGSTGVVRAAERNAAVIADAGVDLLAIPAERYLSDWFKPFTPDEIRARWKRWLADADRSGGGDR